MLGRRMIRWLVVAVVLALPLVMSGVVSAESGCHKAGGDGGGGGKTKVDSPKR